MEQLLERELGLIERLTDAEAAADVHDRRRPAECLAALLRELREPLDRQDVRPYVGELRADVHVEPSHGDPDRVRPFERAEDGIGRQPEFCAQMPGPDRVMRRRVDTGRHPDHGARDSGGCRALRLVGSVQHDERAELGGEPELLVRFVVAVDDEPVARQSRGLRERELAERRDVRAEPLFGEQAQEGHVRERLRAVDDQRVARGPTKESRALAERALAVDDKGRSELVGQGACRHAGDLESAARGRGRFREEC